MKSGMISVSARLASAGAARLQAAKAAAGVSGCTCPARHLQEQEPKVARLGGRQRHDARRHLLEIKEAEFAVVDDEIARMRTSVAETCAVQAPEFRSAAHQQLIVRGGVAVAQRPHMLADRQTKMGENQHLRPTVDDLGRHETGRGEGRDLANFALDHALDVEKRGRQQHRKATNPRDKGLRAQPKTRALTTIALDPDHTILELAALNALPAGCKRCQQRRHIVVIKLRDRAWSPSIVVHFRPVKQEKPAPALPARVSQLISKTILGKRWLNEQRFQTRLPCRLP